MLKLNLGCGGKLRDGYINIDIRKLNDKIVVADVSKLPYEDETVDEIYASDIYEHIHHNRSKELLKHWVSKLKSGGKLLLHTSNILVLCKFTLEQKDIKGIEEAFRRIYGMDYTGGWHLTAGHPEYIKDYLREAGIRGDIKVTMNGWLFWVEAIK
jgi:SAM-dependent methyltransferase